MDLIQAEVGPFGPRIVGTSGRWLGVLQWAMAHSSFVAAGAHRGTLTEAPPPPAGSWVLLQDGSMLRPAEVTATLVRSVAATKWEGYDLWCWTPVRAVDDPLSEVDDEEQLPMPAAPQGVTVNLAIGETAEIHLISGDVEETVVVTAAGAQGSPSLDIIYDSYDPEADADEAIIAWTADGELKICSNVWGYEGAGLHVRKVVVSGTEQPGRPTQAPDHQLRAYLALAEGLTIGSVLIHDAGVRIEGELQVDRLVVADADVTTLLGRLERLPGEVDDLRSGVADIRARLIRLEELVHVNLPPAGD